MHIRWTNPALDDFKTISLRIEQERNLATANRVCRNIYNAIQICAAIRVPAGRALKKEHGN